MTGTSPTPLTPPAEGSRPAASALLLGQSRILGLIGSGAHLSRVLQEFVEELEGAVPGSRCALMLVSAGDGTLSVGYGASLPADLRAELDGMVVGLAPGSPSSAAHRNDLVLSPDVAGDPLWEGLCETMLANGLQACWSTPVRSVQWASDPGQEDEVRVLGTVDFYFEAPRHPTAEELELLDLASTLAALVLITARTHEKVSEQHLYDDLTGLPNRRLFAEQLKQAIAGMSPREHKLGVLLLDIDHFKQVNETFGYAVGDFLLRSVAERLVESRHGDDLLARFGDDEFIFMVRQTSPDTDFREVAGRILGAVAEPHDFSGQQLVINASLGASLFPWDGEDAQTLMRNAENALRAAKQHGRNRYRLYAPTMGANAFEKLQLKMALAYAAENGELELLFQPKVESQSRRVIGVEALCRWNHPSQGRVSPTRFIPLAEETGLILPIGEWVLKRACEQVKQWRDAGFRDMTVAVNISAHQFRERAFVDSVASILERVGIEPQALELEITETVAMTEVKKTMERLHELRSLGLEISIDDFGTGYSSLAYLKRFPISTLKIDRSFVHNLPGDKENLAITKAVIALGNYLGLELVAEGVETEEQVDFLAREGCHYLQGFYFSRPQAAPELSALLQAGVGGTPGHSYLQAASSSA